MSEQAPGRLDLLRRFLNTVSFEAGDDPLQGPDKLPQWCEAEGFECDGEAELGRLRGFREALRALAEANAGHADREASRRALEAFTAPLVFKLEVDGDEARLEVRGSGVDRAIGTLVGVLYDAIRTGQWRRFKACRAGDCRWAFYDESKNGTGVWCTMATCGNRVKARRRRQRESRASKAAAGEA